MTEQTWEPSPRPIEAGEAIWRHSQRVKVTAVISQRGEDSPDLILAITVDGGEAIDFEWTATEAFSCISVELAEREAQALAACTTQADVIARDLDSLSEGQRVNLWESLPLNLRYRLHRFKNEAETIPKQAAA